MSSGRRIAVAACLALIAGMVASADAAVKPVVTNKSRFRIPFRYDAAALQRMNARELQLFVSTNRGGGWELAQSIGPQAGKFEFQAPADGEYWFAVRTIDGFGAAQPPGNRLEAGLIVVVDSIAPSLAVNLDQVSPGRVQLTWSAQDANLDATTLRLEYMQPGMTGWQTVGVVPTQRGNTTWTVAQAGRIAVRGSVSDLAGNVGQTSAELNVVAAPVRPNSDRPDLRQPIAKEPGQDQFSELPPTLTPPSAPSSTPTAPGTADILIQPYTAGRSAPTGPNVAAPGSLTPQTPLVSSAPDRRPNVVQDRWGTPPDEAAAQPLRDPAVRMVAARKFQLGYKLEAVGPSGVSSVELFITPDAGRQWFRYGEDPDRQSPFDVEVPRDGDYGFSIRVRSGAGLALDPPRPGEAPEIRVTVDQTPPRIDLAPIVQGRGPQMNQLMIRWRIQEEHPAAEPVSLQYSKSPSGPWQTISDWMPDQGNFIWTVQPDSPSEIYIRVQARDAAGNTAQAMTPQPVVIDLARPTARFLDVGAAPR